MGVCPCRRVQLSLVRNDPLSAQGTVEFGRGNSALSTFRDSDGLYRLRHDERADTFWAEYVFGEILGINTGLCRELFVAPLSGFPGKKRAEIPLNRRSTVIQKRQFQNLKF
jgi:hypothetical protein